jgi:hypothetical protein
VPFTTPVTTPALLPTGHASLQPFDAVMARGVLRALRPLWLGGLIAAQRGLVVGAAGLPAAAAG